MAEVTSFVFHNKLPVALVDNTEVPLQLSVTLIVGAAGKAVTVTVTPVLLLVQLLALTTST